MKLVHRISFPGGKEFEQHESIFEIESKELEGVVFFKKLNVLQRFQVMQTLLVINGLLFQRAEGYIGKEDYIARKERIISQLADPVKDAFLEVLRNDG